MKNLRTLMIVRAIALRKLTLDDNSSPRDVNGLGPNSVGEPNIDTFYVRALNNVMR